MNLKNLKKVTALATAVVMTAVITSTPITIGASTPEPENDWEFQLPVGDEFTWVVNSSAHTGTRGWSTNGRIHGFDTELKLGTLINADGLVLKVSEEPEIETINLNWMGDGSSSSGIVSRPIDISDIYDAEEGTLTFVFEEIWLNPELPEPAAMYKEFIASKKYARVGLNYSPGIDELGITEAYLYGNTEPCSECEKFPCECEDELFWELELGEFTWDGMSTKGWYSDGADGVTEGTANDEPHETDLLFEVLMNAVGLVIEIDEEPTGLQNIILNWAGDTNPNGVATTGMASFLNVHDVAAGKITLVFDEIWSALVRSGFRSNENWAGIGIQYTPNIEALNIKNVYLFGGICEECGVDDNEIPIPCECENLTTSPLSTSTSVATTTAPPTSATSSSTSRTTAATTARPNNDNNPRTGVITTVTPAIIAAFGVIISNLSKKRK